VTCHCHGLTFDETETDFNKNTTIKRSGGRIRKR
jgi:hypothetical protein